MIIYRINHPLFEGVDFNERTILDIPQRFTDFLVRHTGVDEASTRRP